MTTFERKQVFPSEFSAARPALASQGTELSTLMAWRGDHNSANLNFAFVAMDLAMQPKTTSSNTSQVALALAFLPNHYVVAWIGDDGDRSINVAALGFDGDGSNARIVGQEKLAESSLASPALASSGDAVYLAWAGRDGANTINVMRSADGVTFEPKHIWSGHSTTRAPAIAFNQGRLFVAYTAPDTKLVIVEVDDPRNPEPSFVKRLDESSDFEPALAPFGRHVALAWTGQDGELKLNVGEYDPSPAPSFSKDTFEDSSITGPSLATRRLRQDPHSNVPDVDQLLIAWTGTDGAGTLSAAVVRSQDATG